MSSFPKCFLSLVQFLSKFPRIKIVFPFNLKEYSKERMPNVQSQLLLILTQAYFLFKIIAICFLLAASRYLLILFTELNSCLLKKEENQDKGKAWMDETIQSKIMEMKSIYHMLMACLYCVYIASALTLPLQLLDQFQITSALLFSFVLVCSCGEIAPRVIVDRHHQPRCVTKWFWIITFAKLINKVIPLNRPLQIIFGQKQTRQSNHPVLTKQNVHRLFTCISQEIQQRPIRQEQLELLQKLRQLSNVGVQSLIVPKRNIFLLDINAILSTKLLTHLGKYYFSKILIYEKQQDNIIGYLQFKQLLSFEIDQKISTHSKVICKNIVTLYEDSNLSAAIQLMIVSKINFAVVYGKGKKNFIGLVKLKDIFSKLLLKWYNYGGLTADKSFHSISSLSFSKDPRGGVLQEGEQQI